MLGRQVIQVWEYERGLSYVNGRFDRVLRPGRYVLWPWQHRYIERVDMRETSQTLQRQEALTKDKIKVRVTLVAQYQVTDPITALHTVESYTEQLCQDLQLTLREQIGSRTMEELLEDPTSLSGQLQGKIAPRAVRYGVMVTRVGVRDLILPGTTRPVLLREAPGSCARRS